MTGPPRGHGGRALPALSAPPEPECSRLQPWSLRKGAAMQGRGGDFHVQRHARIEERRRPTAGRRSRHHLRAPRPYRPLIAASMPLTAEAELSSSPAGSLGVSLTATCFTTPLST